MNAYQENRFSMMLAVQKVCNDNNAVWNGLPAFVTAFGLFETAITDIRSTTIKQETDLKGIAEGKTAKQDAMVVKALSICKPMVAYANVTNNATLREEIDFPDSGLRKVRDTESEARCQIVRDRANTNIANLTTYGVTAADVTALAGLITDYHSTIAGPRSAIAMRKSFTEALETKIRNAIKLLSGQLDQLVILFQAANSLFMSDYENARIIVDLGGGPKTFRRTVAAGETKNILKNATDDAEVFEITNRGAVDLKFGRGANSSDMGLGIPVGAGEVVKKTALELGASGNKFLNVQNGGAVVGAYKVVRE